MNIAQRDVEGITILDLDGRLVAGSDSSSLRERVVELADRKRLNIILNLKRVEFIDSTGLGTMVMCFTGIQKQGGALKLLNLSKRHIELLVLTKLTTIFEVFDDEQDAINSFFPDREVRHFDILNFVKSQEKP
ncbi:MAG TPA: STAS domain-containing protein [Bryobacteraceae bacterium]|jgi:anti-sigma B factor antagonist|nr:STAS domain-containing protein [Bryobacteraceae bacterium]HXR77882.1 STAS domain-containing protein [Bryobacteraceae bacterium]